MLKDNLIDKVLLNKIINVLDEENYLINETSSHQPHSATTLAKHIDLIQNKIKKVQTSSEYREDKSNYPNNYNPQNHLNEKNIIQAIAKYYSQKYKTINPLDLDTFSIYKFIPKEFAQYWQIILIDVKDESLTIAHAQPLELRWVRWISKWTGKEIIPILTEPSVLKTLIIEYYQIASSIKNAQQQANEYISKINTNKNESVIDEAYIVRMVNWMLDKAFEYKASDLHIEPTKESLLVKIRIDDILQQFHSFDKPLEEAIINRLKVMSRLDTTEHRLPQDGRFTYNFDKNKENKTQECRISFLPVMYGEKVVIRLLSSQKLVDFDEISMPKDIENIWLRMINNNAGLILVTGPTGSGKTTTLYTSLNLLKEKKLNITTIEDPIEIAIEGFNQMAVNMELGLTFAKGLRAILRQDPNIIMIGEIRDKETAEIALQAALTGHLILSTVHTVDSVTAVVRLMELGIPSYVIKSTLIGILSQRLVRKLCPSCNRNIKITNNICNLNNKFDIVNEREKINFCHKCLHTGYKGRSAIFELLEINQNNRESIQEGLSAQLWKEKLIKQGMKTLKNNAKYLIDNNLTTESEVIRVYPSYTDN